MIAFPNCKVNLGLSITHKRSDGFHDLETIFYPVSFYDALEIIPTSNPSTDKKRFAFTSSGIPVEGGIESNLCIKALRLLQNDFPDLPGVQIHLHKAIPVGAGLGGGSANGAFTLKLLNEKFLLNLSTDQLIRYALQLGSDCPFFIINTPCFAEGRGEILRPGDIDLTMYSIVLINPGIHIETAQVFSLCTPALPEKSIEVIIRQPITTWKEELKNDLEEIVFTQFPAIKKIKEELYDAGALYASMSGSGSTVYGIFAKDKKLDLNFPPDFFVRGLNG